jgi:hypothetical protein
MVHAKDINKEHQNLLKRDLSLRILCALCVKKRYGSRKGRREITAKDAKAEPAYVSIQMAGIPRLFRVLNRNVRLASFTLI